MKSSNTRLLGLAIVAAILISFALLAGRRLRAQPHAAPFEQASLTTALATAKARGTRVFVKFDAAWCPSCKALDREVLKTREGESLLSGMIPLHFDFDVEANRPLIEKYVVMTLPVAIVLDSDGQEIGRISGYENKHEWMAQLKQISTADNPLPALRAAFDKNPSDGHAALELGEALLVRGQASEGEALLERVLWSQESRDDAAKALFVLGRYHHRVRKDARTARHIWRELAARYPESEWAGGAWSWYAKAEAELGHPDLGLEALRSHVRSAPKSADAVASYASFVIDHKLESERAAAAAALQPVLPLVSGDDARELQELAAKLASPL